MSRDSAIRAARRVLERLALPSPALLAAGAGRLIEQDLPLGDVSPFAALPNGSAGEESVAAPNRLSRRDLPERPAQTDRSSGPGPAGADLSKLSAGPLPERLSSASAPPVFSFRRPSAKVVMEKRGAATTLAVEAAAGSRTAPSAAAPVDALERSRPQAPDLPATVSVGQPVDLQPRSGSAPDAPKTPAAKAAAMTTAIEFIDRLATEILTTAPAPDAAASPVAADPISSTARASDSPRAGGLRLVPGGPPRLQPTSSPLAESLANTSARPGATWDAEPLGEPAPAGFGLDADTLASLVNDVLAEQAQRHGVDLS